MKEVDDEDRLTVRQRLASQRGFTGLSILDHLHQLYQFGVLKDLAFDTIRTLVFHVNNHHLQYYNELGLLKNPVLGKRLQKMPLTAGS